LASPRPSPEEREVGSECFLLASPRPSPEEREVGSECFLLASPRPSPEEREVGLGFGFIKHKGGKVWGGGKIGFAKYALRCIFCALKCIFYAVKCIFYK
jgi:hypothetical protein